MKGVTIKSVLIAPCGMNCALCISYQRDKNKCVGCNGMDAGKPNYCRKCAIKGCEMLKGKRKKFCSFCEKFPCARIKNLDKRYRDKYHMGMIENLENIRKLGIREFVRKEKSRWKCRNCGGVVCVHRDDCVSCGKKVF